MSAALASWRGAASLVLPLAASLLLAGSCIEGPENSKCNPDGSCGAGFFCNEAQRCVAGERPAAVTDAGVDAGLDAGAAGLDAGDGGLEETPDAGGELDAGETDAGSPCGNGKVEAGEGCDDANLSPLDGCAADCSIELGFSCAGTRSVCQKCGNGIREGSEGCDDQNLNGGDGCAANCAVEVGFVCGGSPYTCTDVEWTRWAGPTEAPSVGDYTTAAGAVTDRVTSLVWQQDGTFFAVWANAGAHCENLVLAGKSDWRLPTLIELESLVSYGRTSPASAFPAMPSSYFWSSTPSPSRVWALNFDTGESAQLDPIGARAVRCVR